MIRTFAKKLQKEIALDLFSVTLTHNNASSIPLYIMNGAVDFINDLDLFNIYIKSYEESYYKLKIFEEGIFKYLSDVFHCKDPVWTADPYYFALNVTIDVSDDYDTTPVFENGFIEIEANSKIAFRELYLTHQDVLVNVYPELFLYTTPEGELKRKKPIAITLQTTDDCNLRCDYCYQINKSHHVMSIEMANRAIDFLLNLDTHTTYANPDKYPAIALELIGGEAMMHPHLIDHIIRTTLSKMINTNHPWLKTIQMHVGTNGVNYFAPPVFAVYEKWRNVLNISITVDGNKKLHDKCRLFPDGSGSYDLAHKALMYELEHGYGPSTKITLAPDNIVYIKDAIIDLINEGIPHIWFNAIYEHTWTGEEASRYLTELKAIADYIIDNNLYNHVEVSIFRESKQYRPMTNNDSNWCGGDGSMLTIDYKGDMYNCIRYMESSLGDDQPPLIIGNINDGIGFTEESIKNVNCMQCINRRSQSTDECYYCPIADGCAWCSAYNYQAFGTPNIRSTNICNIHKANALGTAYFMNRIYEKEDSVERMTLDWVDPALFKSVIGDANLNSVIHLKTED